MNGRAPIPGAPPSKDAPALYQRIIDDLTARIRDGAWPPGHRIPFEHELMASWGCSRATANKAVHSLVAAGLVERRRRAGSFVAQPRLQTALLEIPEFHSEIERRGQTYSYSLLARRISPIRGSDPAETRLTPTGRVLRLEGLHRADGAPFALEHRNISLEAVPRAADIEFTTTSPGAWLLSEVRWSEGEHRISAVGADAVQAVRLGLAEGAPCLLLRRWTWRASIGITYARQWFPSGAFELAAKFSPRA